MSDSNPLQLKPLGHLFLHPEAGLTKVRGLGRLAALPDDLLLSQIFSNLDAETLIRCSRVSKAFFAWSRIEGVWKNLYISATNGRLLHWHGSWRASYVATFLRPKNTPLDEALPSDGITAPSMTSDVLFQPCLCASFDANTLFGKYFVPTIAKRSGVGLTPADLPSEPVILTGLMDRWPAMQPGHRRWTLHHLQSRFPDTLLRAEATLATLPDYSGYHDQCGQDESPLYLFESDFVNKTESQGEAGLGDDFVVPECFRQDLFEVMGNMRPNYRWLIAGPERSGSTWHQDPNGTSAWNAVTVGRKAWVMFPNDVLPPGVRVSDDMAHVEAPLSLAEWFQSYYKQAKLKYGAKAKDPATRGKMREGICEQGEIMFVPSGWWHGEHANDHFNGHNVLTGIFFSVVVNLEPAIAVTQNFVSSRELPDVLKFMKYRPEQVSGFKIPSAAPVEEGGLDEADEALPGVFELFVEALRAQRPLVAQDALDRLQQHDIAEQRKGEPYLATVVKDRGLWAKVKQEKENAVSEGFSFGFDLAGQSEDEAET
ncbi:hypothetical protein OIO90_000997 [Microbotryomycetes sp. JL221]|nr:hypothetical protein OIO90_000997 [Microbotryomycetes sp. JL221]